MTWSKLDDRFHEHPKILGLGADEFRLYVCSITYSSAHGTDGFIATVAAVTLCAQQRVRRSTIRGLVAAGCWEEDGAKGYRIHDYGDYQPTGRRTQELSEIRRKAGLAGAKKRWQTAAEPEPRSMANEMESDGKPDGKLPMAKHAPVPVPVPSSGDVGDESVSPGVKDTLASPNGEALVLTGQGTSEQRVFEAWKQATGRTGRVVFTTKRRDVVHVAVQLYGEADCIDAVRGWRHSPHHSGENDRGTVYNDLELLLRDAKHIEQFRDLERNGPRPIRMRIKPTLGSVYTELADRLRQQEQADNGAFQRGLLGAADAIEGTARAVDDTEDQQ